MVHSPHDAHARFRFSVIGSLLSAPPAPGELHAAIDALARKTWHHPLTGAPTRYGFSTIERWYYTARDAQNPVEALRRGVRKDAGKSKCISTAFSSATVAQHRLHPSWTMQLHHDNLRVVVDNDPAYGPLPSYASFVRFMKSTGLRRTRRSSNQTPGQQRALRHLEEREVRSYELDHVGALWHLDFHTSNHIAVLTPTGVWQKPELVAFLDDHSRLCCHAQFYLSETTEDLVHALSQAILKRGKPREVLSDNGSAMIAEEFTEGLSRLSIQHETTLAYSPYQNGKQEHFWHVVEGRLMAMLEDVPELTLERLNAILQAWVEQDYHRRFHSEIHTTPLDRFRNAPDVSRPSPTVEDLRDAFRRQVHRTPRKSDGTFTLDAIRFEIPAAYRHIPKLTVRYARWDLGYVHLVDQRTGKVIARVFPLDRSKNASGLRRRLTPPQTQITDARPAGELPPLLRRLLEDHAATGLPPSYLPKFDLDQHEGYDDAAQETA